MTQAAEPHYFTEKAVQDWTRIAARHRIRDEYFLRAVARYFRPGPVLEIGAATGHLSEILQQRGFDVTASDVSPRFVAAIEARGVRAQLVDATANIRAQAGRSFGNVLAQGVIPLVRRDPATANATLAAIHAALDPRGRLICISPHAWRDPDPQSYFRPHEQIEFAKASGLYHIIKVFPHQVVPTALYRSWNAGILNFLDFHAARLAAVRLVWVAEKIG